MHWKRRQPKWPYLVSLVCLLFITIAAPWSWQQPAEHDGLDARPSLDAAEEPAPPSAAPELKLGAPAPALPPLAAPTAPEPSLAGPMVIADDYVVVDEPLTIFEESAEPVASIEQVEHAPAEPAPTAAPGPSAVAEDLALRPPGRSVLVRNVAPPARAIRSVFSVESLVKVRDALTQALVQLREVEAAAAAAEAPAPPRVMVSSENDRLAMVPPRNAPVDAVAAPSPSELETTTAPAPVEAPAGRPALRYRPTALIAELQAFDGASPGRGWASQVLTRIEQMSDASAPAERDWQPTVAELQILAERGFNEALTVADPADQSQWLRASRSLDRRLPVWSLLVDRQYIDRGFDADAWSRDNGGLMHSLHEVAALTAGAGAGMAWRQYLRLDDIAGLTSVGGDEFAESRRAVARNVLVRITDPWLTAQQREFLTQAPIISLGQRLRPWATGEVPLETLAALVERYEATGSNRDGDAIAELRLRMKWSADSRLQALGEELNRHYRNANMRVALSAEMMNRMIPPQEPITAPVRSRIAGADVRGHSQTQTQIIVRLLPDAKVWRFGLEAHGQVNSRTASQTWPAQLRNASRMEYEARKLVLVNRHGMHVFPAEANAEGDTRLLGVESSFGGVPIIGSIIESAAREQHHQSRPRAVAQVKAKVSQEARDRMDREAGERLARLNDRFRQHVLEPLDRFAMTAEPVDMNTTEERATMRIRLAAEQQLAAHTPRPSAPSDSLASFQLHESVFNNAARGLELDGKRLTVPQLHELLSQKIRRHAQAEPADLPRAAKVEFAEHDAIRVRCHGDRLELILDIVELRHGRDSIRGVGVHAFFRPVVEGMEVKLVRDGTLQFAGAHLRTGPRLVLHSVFGKLLPKDQEVPVLAAKIGEDPRFAGMMVTQLVIDDGWVALSVGPATPQRTAWRTRDVQIK